MQRWKEVRSQPFVISNWLTVGNRSEHCSVLNAHKCEQCGTVKGTHTSDGDEVWDKSSEHDNDSDGVGEPSLKV